MHKLDLKQIDLNLLVILAALLEQRHVTRAAESLHMSQPAVSRALQRLRTTFSDPLLVKSVHGYDLTQRAEEIAPQLKALLTDLSTLINPTHFDPVSSNALIRFACLDLEGALFLPQILQRMRIQAPLMRLQVESQPGNHFRLLQQGDVDFVISGLAPDKGHSEIRRIHLARTRIVCLMDQHNPLAQQPLTLDAYVAASHGVVAMTGIGGAVMDKRLDRLGLKRRVIVHANSFLTIPEYLVGTDLIYALPELLARRLVSNQPLLIRELPTELSGDQINFYLYWHQRYHSDPKHQWIRANLLNKQR